MNAVNDMAAFHNTAELGIRLKSDAHVVKPVSLCPQILVMKLVR